MIEEMLVAVIVFLLFSYIFIGNKRLPPGPFRLPIIGSAIQIYLTKTKFKFLGFAKLAETYGDVFSFGFGNKIGVMVSSYESMQEIFKVNDTKIGQNDTPFIKDRNFGKNLGIVFSYGQTWADVRTYTKKVLREFGYGKVKVMQTFLNESANQVVDDIKTSLLDSCDGTLTVKNSVFSIHVLNIVWNMVGGYKFDTNDANLLQAMKCLDKVVVAYSNNNISNALPFLKTWCPKLVNYHEHLKIHAEIHGFSKFLIDHAKERRSERLETEPISVIEAFLDKIEEEHGNPDTIFTMEQLQVVVEDLFFGSLGTTGNLLAFAILFMVLNPDKQTKVRQVICNNEVDQNTFSAAELKRKPYVKATILEILRKGNIGPIPATRVALADVKYKDYIIPKDTVFFYNLHPIYADKAYWKDPEAFRPERYLNENGDIDQSKSDRVLKTVFGAGSRKCFGELLAMDTLYTFVATLVANFKFDSIPGKEPSLENCNFSFILAPDAFNVKVTKLSI